jgi:predicted DNA-binding antitoxin AbrB/MazE fold protein
MDHLISAVFDSGVFRPLEPVDLAQGTQVQIQVPLPAQPNGVISAAPQDEWEQRVVALARDCGVSLSDSALGSDGLYE